MANKKAEIEKQEEIIEASPSVLIVEHSNGCLNLSRKAEMKYECYKSAGNKLQPRPQRILVANSSRLCYAGSNFETDVSKMTSTSLKVCVINSKTSSIELYDADFFHLKPVLKCPEIKQENETKTYLDMNTDLTLAFGSKIKQRVIKSRIRYKMESEDLSIEDIEIKEVQTNPEKSGSPTESSLIPPQNSSAAKVDEIYNLDDIISKEEYDALDEFAAPFVDCSEETLLKWRQNNEYSAFTLQYIENNFSMSLHQAKLLCYLNYMFIFLNTVYTDWRKKNPVSNVPDPFRRKLIDSFTVYKSMPQRLKDKMGAHAIVLGLMLKNYNLSSAEFATAAKLPIKSIDSILLLEEGFKIMSVDASDKMLKYALKQRWNRRREPGFDDWVIEEANWLTLPDDIHKPNNGFDCVICLGNSFAHLFDIKGDLSDIKLAIKNFHDMLKPNGYLLIDHRNYDYTLKHGKTPAHSIYYNSKHIKDIQTSILYTGDKPTMVMLDYTMDISDIVGSFDATDTEYTKRGRYHGSPVDHFRLSYHPHKLQGFTDLLKDVFGESASHQVFGDFKPLDQVTDPAFFIHFIQKRA